MAGVDHPNLSCVEVANSAMILREVLANFWSYLLFNSCFFFPFFNMIQLNNLEGDYNTGIDYGTVDESETQSPFGTSGPNEVIPTLFLPFFL